VDDEVEAAKLSRRALDECTSVVRAREIAVAAPGSEDLRAVGAETRGDRRSDAARPSGDECTHRESCLRRCRD
jgi:hypothetical protein